MGELFRNCIKKLEDKLAPAGLRTCIYLGKIVSLDSEDTSEFQINLLPRYKDKGTNSKENILITKEILTIVERLKKADSQPKVNISEEKKKSLIEEVVTQLKTLEITEDQSKNQEQELLNEIKRLKAENEKLIRENQQLKEQQVMQQIQVQPK